MKHGGKQEEFNKESQWDNMWRGKIPKAYPKNEHKYMHTRQKERSVQQLSRKEGKEVQSRRKRLAPDTY